MSDYLNESPSLEVRHVPDYTVEDTGYGSKEKRELPGHVLVGVTIGGVFKPLAKFGKAGLDADVERVQSEQASQQGEQQVQPQQTGAGTASGLPVDQGNPPQQ